MSFKIFDGSSWNTPKKLNIFDGGAWQSAKKALSWNGSAWVEFYSGQSNITAPEFTWSAGSFGYGAGQTVSVSNGTWTIEPDSYKYQWQRGYNRRVPDLQEDNTPYTPPREKTEQVWEDISSATSNARSLTKDDVGYFLRCKVIAVTGGTDSEPSYASIDGSPLPPQKISSSMAFVQQDSAGYVNGKIRFFWDVSEGADGYYVTYQGPGIPAHTETIIGKTNNLYDKDFGATDPTALFGLTTLGISVQPFNNTSPALNWWRWATANNSFDFTGTGSSQSILDLLPNKPTVTATISATGLYDDQAGKIEWSLNNITPTRYEIWSVWPDGSDYGPVPMTGINSNSSYLTNYSPGTLSGPWKVRVYGTSSGFRGTPTVVDIFNPTQEYYWESNSGTFTSAFKIPANGTVFIDPTGDVYSGTTISASTSGWDFEPSSYTVKIIGKAGSVPSSVTDGVELRSGTSPQSYTVDASDVQDGIRYRAFASATNSAGTSSFIASSESAKATVNPPVAVTIPNFVRQNGASNGTNYTIYYAAGTGTSDNSLTGKIASQSPGAGTYYVAQADLPLQVSVSSYVYQEPAVVYKYVPNYVGTSTADGTYGDWTLTTNQNTGTTNAALAGQIVSQSPIAGSAYDTRYVTFPTSVSINRYQYQAPGYKIYVFCVGTSGDYGGAYTSGGGTGDYPTDSSNRTHIRGTTDNPNLTGAQIVSLLGIPNACYVPPFGFTPFGFTPFGFTPFGFTPFGFTPFGFTPFGFTPIKSIGADTLVASKVPEGLVLAHNLSVGDILYSADIEGLDLTSGQTLADYFSDWSAENPVINTNYETTIVGLSARIVDKVVVINGNKYSYSHYILVKRENITKFIKVNEVLETDMVYSPLFDGWQPIIDLKMTEGKELVISINTEPYDVFFSDNAILHDSHEFDANTPGAITSPDQNISSSLEQLYQEWKLSQGE
jgi:hypothetical protein